MAGETPAQAVENFLQPIQRALACVTPERLDRGRDNRPGRSHALTVGGGAVIPLSRRSGYAGRFGMQIGQQYRVVEAEGEYGPWKVQTRAYSYTLRDANENEMLVYHWHPDGASGIRYPHVHFKLITAAYRSEVSKAHLPTGRVSIEAFLRLLIEGFGVRHLRDDWDGVLRRTQAAFERWRTWA